MVMQAINYGDGIIINTNVDNINNVIAGITDSSFNNPYMINVGSGTFSPWSFQGKTNITVAGSGINSTIVKCSQGAGNRINMDGLGNSIQSMRVDYLDNPSGNMSSPNSAVGKQVLSGQARVQDVDIWVSADDNHTGPRYGLDAQNGGFDGALWGWELDNVNIYTNSYGVAGAGGQFTMHGGRIQLLPDGNSDQPLIGVEHISNGRMYFYGTRITTGYNFARPQRATAPVIGVHVPASNDGPSTRIHLYGCQGFARNEHVGNTGKTRCVLAENGWVRTYGCEFQAEDDDSGQTITYEGVWGTANEPASGEGGKFELWNSRGNALNSFGQDNVGLTPAIIAAHSMGRYEGAVQYLDSSGGAFTLELYAGDFFGERINFINAGPNPVTLDSKAGNEIVDGVVSAQTYVIPGNSVVQLYKRDSTSWYVLNKT